jgi:formylglycine-generating enzyme required for sulfatase activity
LETRNAGATYFIPTENEWYKAAYYDPTLNGGAGGYWIYPTKSNTTPSNVLSPTGTNNANNYNVTYTDSMNYLTPVGSFILSPGPYGTYDMGGDILQWNEADIPGGIYFSGSTRGMRGGAFSINPIGMASLNRYYWPPTDVNASFGFRVASVPEPSTLALLAAGAIGLAGYGLRWRRATRTAKPVAFDQQDAPAILSFPSCSCSAHAARRAA